MINAVLSKSDKKDKKYKVVVEKDNKKKTIHFGAKGMSDYTKNKDPARKSNYESRHKAREDWTKSGITTAGFWAKHILWNKPTIDESVKSTEKRFNLDIIKK